MDYCPFCIIDEKRHRILWRGARVYVMASNPRLVSNHLLVIPERHVETPPELDQDECHELFDTVLMFQERILKLGIGTGCDVRQHWRPFLPESDRKVNHLHWHLLPRNLNDELYEQAQCLEDVLFRKLSSEEMETQIALLQAQFFPMRNNS